MYSFCYSIQPLLQHFKNEQKACNKTIQRLLTQDARITPKVKGTDSELVLSTSNREKRGIFSIITG